MSATGGERVCEKMIAEHCIDIALSVMNKVRAALDALEHAGYISLLYAAYKLESMLVCYNLQSINRHSVWLD